MFHTLVQQHSLRELALGGNKFDVTTLPAIVPTMTEIEELDISNLGYTYAGVCYQTCRQLCSVCSLPSFAECKELWAFSCSNNQFTGECYACFQWIDVYCP